MTITIPATAIYNRTKITERHIELLIRSALIKGSSRFDIADTFTLFLHYTLINETGVEPWRSAHILQTLSNEYGVVFDVAYTNDRHSEYNQVGRGPYLVYQAATDFCIKIVLAYEFLCASVIVDIGYLSKCVVDTMGVEKKDLEELGYPKGENSPLKGRSLIHSGIKGYLETPHIRR